MTINTDAPMTTSHDTENTRPSVPPAPPAQPCEKKAAPLHPQHANLLQNITHNGYAFAGFCRSWPGILLGGLALWLGILAFFPVVMELYWDKTDILRQGIAVSPLKTVWQSYDEWIRFNLKGRLADCLRTAYHGGSVFGVGMILAGVLFFGRYVTTRTAWALAGAVHLAVTLDIALPFFSIGTAWRNLTQTLHTIVPGAVVPTERIYGVLQNTVEGRIALQELLESTVDTHLLPYDNMQFIVYGLMTLLTLLTIRLFRTRNIPPHEWMLGTLLLWAAGRTLIFYKAFGALVLFHDSQLLDNFTAANQLGGTFWPIMMWLSWAALLVRLSVTLIAQKTIRFRNMNVLKKHHIKIVRSEDGLSWRDYACGARFFLWSYLAILLSWMSASWIMSR